MSYKDLPPVPPHPPYPIHPTQSVPDSDDFTFVDPNAHIDNSLRQPTNPHLSLNNRIIYDYDTDNESDGAPIAQAPAPAQRELARQNEFYSQTNPSGVSRQSSTHLNPFKEDPFVEGRRSHNTETFEQPFENVPMEPEALTSLLNPYRNNKFYNNGSNTMNGGFRVDDEFQPGELRPRFIDPAAEKPAPTGLLVWRGKKIPVICYILTIIQTAVFFGELGKMGSLTGTPVQTKPYFNPMIGPSNYVQINMGLRFVPCMILISGITSQTLSVFPCPNLTTQSTGCTLDTLCGLGGMTEDSDGFKPRQWYRIITPVFLHAGFIHIICNLALQLLLGVDMERQIGLVLFLIIYMASGILGNIFGANFAQQGLSLTGASGALFGIIGVNLIHFVFFTNRSQIHPKVYRRNLSYLLFEIVFTLVLGLLPGLDNFSHIGGFVMGCLLSVLLLKDPNFVFQERYRYQRDPRELNKSAIPARHSLNLFTPFEYDGSAAQEDRSNIRVINSKVHRFLPNMNIRKPAVFMGWIGVRVVAGVFTFLWFYLLCVNFFKHGGGHCSWCKYLSCIPVKDWCTMGTILLEEIGQNTSQVMILSLFMAVIGGHAKYMRHNVKAKTE